MHTRTGTKVGNVIVVPAVAAVLVMLAAQPGQAVQVEMDHFGWSGDSRTDIDSGPQTGQMPAGAILWNVQNGDHERMVTFCVQLDAVIPLNPTNYSGSGNAPSSLNIDADREALVSQWFGQYFAPFEDFVESSMMSWNPTEAIAFQLGLWEILYEDLDDVLAGQMDVTAGDFATSRPAGWESSLDLANTWLAEMNPDLPGADLLWLSNEQYQDQVTMVPPGEDNPPRNPPKTGAPVPEPVTGTLAAMGLAALGLVAGRRRRPVHA